jgi:uncharacterized beta-barrel protein YwiB (DUF1934 family)
MSGSSPEQIPVTINVKNTITSEGNQETFELTTLGRYYKKENSFYLQYEEISDEGKIKTVVKIAEDDALILRSGSVKMRMAFRLAEQLNGSYDSPYGTLKTTTDTKAMKYQELTDNDGYIDLLYDLSMHGSKAGTYHLQINFKEESQ